MTRDPSVNPQGSRRGSTPPDVAIGGGAQEPVTYRGVRDPAAPVGKECTVTVDGEPLDRRYDLLSASPSGFEWGYRGSGPAQLAVALLAHAYSDEFAVQHYQRFKREVLSDLPEAGWTLTRGDLEAWRQGVEDA